MSEPDDRAPLCHRPFFAFLPPPEALSGIAAVRDTLPRKGRMQDDRLHMTLLMIDDVPALAPALVATLRAVGERMVSDAPEIVLDRLVVGPGHAVLVPRGPQRRLRAFQADLAGHLVQAGLRVRADWRFSPHITLAYNRREPGQDDVAPIRWMATDLVLIDSWVGLTRHERLGSWQLTEQARLF